MIYRLISLSCFGMTLTLTLESRELRNLLLLYCRTAFIDRAMREASSIWRSTQQLQPIAILSLFGMRVGYLMQRGVCFYYVSRWRQFLQTTAALFVGSYSFQNKHSSYQTNGWPYRNSKLYRRKVWSFQHIIIWFNDILS